MPIDYGVRVLGAPEALVGLLVAVLLLAPESLSAIRAALANIVPDSMLAEQHRKMAEPGSARNN